MQDSASDSTMDSEGKIESEIELEIFNFYIRVLKSMWKFYHPKFQDVRKSLSNIRRINYLMSNPEQIVCDIVSFNKTADRLAYIFAYCFIHATVMHDQFSKMLNSNPEMKEKIISMTHLRLCILGGGPGFEVVSICKVINILRKQSDENCRPLSLNVTIIDVCDAWKNDAELIFATAQSEICDSSNIKIYLKFLTCDLMGDISKDVRKNLKKAHIVTMFKFVSDINASLYTASEIHQMIQEIVKHTNHTACLFLLENAGGDCFKKTDKIIDEHENMTRIYKETHTTHLLSSNSVELISQSRKFNFRNLKCTVRITVSCSAWIKIDDVKDEDEFSINPKPKSVHNTAFDPDKHEFKDRKVKVKKVCQSVRKRSELFGRANSRNLIVSKWQPPQ